MTTVGLRELRQDASDLVRRAEQGEEIVITVSGRPSARLVAAGPRRWCTWDQTAALFNGVEDTDWASDRDAVDQSITDPWVR